MRTYFQEKITQHAGGWRGRAWLGAISFAESSFFPIPPDVFLMAALLGKERTNWFRYALWTGLWSVVGGIFGYLIGAVFFQAVGAKLVAFYHLEAAMQTVGVQFGAHAFVAILVAGFTPIPYKAFTIAAGFFHIALVPFILASLISRTARFLIVAYVTSRIGARFGERILKHFDFIMIAILAVAVLFAALLLN